LHLELPDQLRALEADVRAFLAGRLPLADNGSARLAFFEALFQRGWSVPLWPGRWGGGEMTVGEAFVIDRTLTAAGAPVPDRLTVDLVGPLLMSTAGDVACQRWLPAMARGAVRACCHGSLTGDAPLSGAFAHGTFRPQQHAIRAYNAGEAQVFTGIATDGVSAALVLARLEPAAIERGAALDADTVLLEALAFDVLASAPSTAALLGSGPDLSRARLSAGRSCTGRLRHLLTVLGAMDPAADTATFEVSLTGLEVMELRALAAGREAGRAALGHALEIRASELGQALAEQVLGQLGYYALADPDPSRQHNELPAQALAARGAVAELIRYLLADIVGHRDALARFADQGTTGNESMADKS
jgi:hypothetical protein